MSVYSGQTGVPAGRPSGVSFIQPWHRWQDWVNLILGVWLVATPWVSHSVGLSPAGDRNAWVLGVIVIVFSLAALSNPMAAWTEWINTLAGLWLFIAPWALGFARVAHGAAASQWVVGIVVAVLAIWAGSQADQRMSTT